MQLFAGQSRSFKCVNVPFLLISTAKRKTALSISVQNITKVYGQQKAVDDITFSVNSDEIVGFLGPNGAGKSTTMKILTCYIPQSAGIASVCGYDVVSDPIEVRRQVGYLPEHNPLYLDMYIKEYLTFMAELHGMKKGIAAQVSHMIDITGLAPEKNKKIGQLSKGYRQRVGLAQAMIHDPKVLILDEPTSGLDPNQLVEIRQLIRDIGKHKTVILSTHIMQEVEALCNRVIIINKGRIVADDKTSLLQSKFRNEAVLVVEFRNPVRRDALERIPGISSLTELGTNKWKIISAGMDTLKEEVFRVAVENNTIILSMNEEEQRLEEVFQQLTGKKKK